MNHLRHFFARRQIQLTGCFIACCLLGIALAFPSPTLATVYVAMNDSDLADGTQLILEGSVVDLSPWGDDGRPQTRYTVQVDKIHKGTWDSPAIQVDLPGGRGRAGALWWVAGTPRWQSGDRVLLFLTPSAEGGWTLQQFFLGGFSVTFEDGAWVAQRDLSGGHQLHLPNTPSPLDGRRDLAAFTQWLQDRSQGILRQPDYFLVNGVSEQAAGPTGDDGALDDGNHPAKSQPIKFASLLSPTDPWPLGCDNNGGNSLRWFQFEAGATVPWRSHFVGQAGLPGRGVEELRRAIETWQVVPDTLVDLTYEGITAEQAGLRRNDGNNVVLFEDPNDEIGGTWQGSGVMALGGPWFNCALSDHRGGTFHRILEADIVLQDGLSTFFDSMAEPAVAAEELLAHELGHSLGLGHSSAPESLMVPHLHNDGRGANLSADDHAALLYLYGMDNAEPPPDRPRALQAQVLYGLRVQLSWLDFSDNETGFRIERRRRGQPYESIGTTPPNVTRWIDEDVQPGIEYSYRIRAHNGGGPSTTSNRVIVLTPEGAAPFAPSQLRAAPLSYERIQLTWQDNAEDETNYVLELLIPGSSDWLRAPFLGAADTTALVVSGLDSGRRYAFRVVATNDFGASAASNVAWVSTLSSTSPCRVDGDTLCLLDGRFRVDAEFSEPGMTSTQIAHGVPSTDHTGFFWFFQPGNFELVVKMVDGRQVNGAFWVFYDGITDLGFRLRITDTLTGRQQVYENPAGELCGRSDTRAFSDQDGVGVAPPLDKGRLAVQMSPQEIEAFLKRLHVQPLSFPDRAWAPEPRTPDTASGVPEDDKALLAPCQPDDTTLCLLDERLSVRVDFTDPHNNSREGRGRAIQGTSQSGQFWFFQLGSTELVVKAIDGTQSNGNLWLFLGSLTDVEFALEVTDTLTGEQKTYYNPAGQVCGQVDLDAFSGVLLGTIP